MTPAPIDAGAAPQPGPAHGGGSLESARLPGGSDNSRGILHQFFGVRSRNRSGSGEGRLIADRSSEGFGELFPGLAADRLLAFALAPKNFREGRRGSGVLYAVNLAERE